MLTNKENEILVKVSMLILKGQDFSLIFNMIFKFALFNVSANMFANEKDKELQTEVCLF